MIFRQLYHMTSGTYTYLLGGRVGGEALIIDPVQEQVERYLTLLDELGLTLAKVVDTHVHADHISGMAALRDRTKCVTVMGREAPVDVVSMRVGDGDPVEIEGVALSALHTPGHTAESYSFAMEDRVFTGDTLLIRGTGRTDFQNGDALQQYKSLFGKLLALPDETLVYPGHDYKGDTVSTIGEEKRFNPRLQVASADDYAAIMNGLNLADPKMMDVAVPANLSVGLGQANDAHTRVRDDRRGCDARPAAGRHSRRPAGGGRAGTRRSDPRLGPRALRPARRHDRAGRDAPRARRAAGASAGLLPRLRRTLRHGGRRLARERPRQRLPHDRRDRRLARGRRRARRVLMRRRDRPGPALAPDHSSVFQSRRVLGARAG